MNSHTLCVRSRSARNSRQRNRRAPPAPVGSVSFADHEPECACSLLASVRPPPLRYSPPPKSPTADVSGAYHARREASSMSALHSTSGTWAAAAGLVLVAGTTPPPSGREALWLLAVPCTTA